VVVLSQPWDVQAEGAGVHGYFNYLVNWRLAWTMWNPILKKKKKKKSSRVERQLSRQKYLLDKSDNKNLILETHVKVKRELILQSYPQTSACTVTHPPYHTIVTNMKVIAAMWYCL
jgi:transposase